MFSFSSTFKATLQVLVVLLPGFENATGLDRYTCTEIRVRWRGYFLIL